MKLETSREFHAQAQKEQRAYEEQIAPRKVERAKCVENPTLRRSIEAVAQRYAAPTAKVEAVRNAG